MKGKDSTAADPPPARADSDSSEAIARVLNSLDALIYVADMDTHEVLFMNDYGKSLWGEPGDRKCYQILQKGLTAACEFCTNDKLLDRDGKPAGVHVWEFQNTHNGHWYQCRDQAIRWTDGRLVRMEIATDISDRKRMEQELEQARARAEALADTDELTGLYNRRAFFNYGNRQLQQARRLRQSVAVIMFDLDHFKHVNDRWGHAAGDQLLQALARTANTVVRESDILARLGGEEFAILLPATGLHDARLLAQRLRQAVADMRLQFQQQPLQCTASFGVASFDFASADTDRPEPADATLDALLSHADRALFVAKQSGRNCIEVDRH